MHKGKQALDHWGEIMRDGWGVDLKNDEFSNILAYVAELEERATFTKEEHLNFQTVIAFEAGYNEALEEAAKVAHCYPSAAWKQASTGEKIAEQIRALKT